MKIDLTGKNALVTGAGSGIGSQIAIDLAKAGANVVVHYYSNEKGAQHTVHTIRQQNVEATAIKADVLIKDEITDLVNKTSDFFNGQIDILINNAGGLVKRTPIKETSEDLWHKIIDLNLTSAFLVTQAVLPTMKRDGNIINITSLAAQNGGGQGAVPYATSKGGLMAFTKGLAKEVAPIRVNNISPGLIGETSFHDTFTPDADRKKTVDATPLKREGIPGDVSGAALYLASDLSSFVTGETIEINGGTLMR